MIKNLCVVCSSDTFALGSLSRHFVNTHMSPPYIRLKFTKPSLCHFVNKVACYIASFVATYAKVSETFMLPQLLSIMEMFLSYVN